MSNQKEGLISAAYQTNLNVFGKESPTVMKECIVDVLFILLSNTSTISYDEDDGGNMMAYQLKGMYKFFDEVEKEQKKELLEHH